MQPSVKIGDRLVGKGQPCFVIAEAGVNHNGDVALAKKLIEVAAEAKADAVKFQTFDADRLATASAAKASYQVRNTGGGESQRDMLARLQLSEAAHGELLEHCRRCGITFLSSPFDELAADLLFGLNVPAVKIASGEASNIPFLRHVARGGRPIILSTGMCDVLDVATALQAIRGEGNEQIVLLHCLSDYPATPEQVNLAAMASMASAFGFPVGYSDHTLGSEITLAAVALGATVIEKHFTLDRTMEGPDHRASLEPAELKEMMGAIRRVEASIGDGIKRVQESERETRVMARKSIFAVRPLAAGETFGREHLALQRPATGLPPSMLDYVIGRKAKHAIAAGSAITMQDLD